MAEKSNFSDLFYVLMLVLSGALVIFGGLVTWKLVRSAAPQVERVHIDPDQLLEKGLGTEKEKDSPALELAELRNKKSDVERINFWQEPEETEEESVEPETNLAKQLSIEQNPTEQIPAEQLSAHEAPQQPQEPEVPAEENLPSQETASLDEFSYTLEDVSVPQSAPQQPANVNPPAKKETPPQNVYESYEQGLLRCQKEQVFPCAWKDNSSEPLIKQYWLRNWQGPVERIIYTRGGKVISRTNSTLDGQVLSYKGPYAELYFEDGLLTKIRTFPYENPDLRDWFLIGKDGKLSACLCGKPAKDCCSRSLLYREGGHRKYCEIFPRDVDFCK